MFRKRAHPGTKEAFIHIGAPKTASSFLQANLKLHTVRLRERGLGVVTRANLIPSVFRKEIYEVSQGRHRATEVTQAAKRSLSSLLPDRDCNLLISHEGLICGLRIQNFFPNADNAITYLRTALYDFDLHVILYVRKQADYLESIYMQYAHLSRRASFPHFVQRAASVDLSWLRVAEAIGRTLPTGHLHLRTYEQIQHLGHAGFYRDFLSLCRVSDVESFTIEEDYAKGRAANRSYSQLGMQIARRVNPLLSRTEKRLLRNFLQEHFSTATHPRAVLLNEDQRREIFETYRESNRELFARYDLGMDGNSLGYF